MDFRRVKTLLKQGDLRKLFIEELGWDAHDRSMRIVLDRRPRILEGIAHKHGVVVFRYDMRTTESISDRPFRERLERQVAKSVHEHLIVFADAEQGIQVWLWVKREPGRPPEYCEHHFRNCRNDDRLCRKLKALSFGFDEQDLGLIEVVRRVRSGFHDDRDSCKDLDVTLTLRRGIKKSDVDMQWIATRFCEIAERLGMTKEKLCAASYKNIVPKYHSLIRRIETHVVGQQCSEEEYYKASEITTVLRAIRMASLARAFQNVKVRTIHPPPRLPLSRDSGEP